MTVAEQGWATRPLSLGGRRVRPQDVAWLMRQLAITERAGLPIKRALDTLAAQRHGSATGALIDDIRSRLNDGEDLARAFGAHVDEIGAVAAALVAAGTASGMMASTFETVADMYDEQVALHRKVRGALTYPLVVLSLSVVLTVAMLVFVVPTFKSLYGQLNGRLPWPTRVLLGLSGVVRRGALVGLLAGGAAAGVYRRWRLDPDHLELIDRAKCRLPLVGRLLIAAAIARVAATLAGLLKAGVTTLVAIDMAADAAGLLHVRASLLRVGAAVRGGRTVAAALAGEGSWPAVMVQLAEVGEETGQVAELLNRYADVTQEEVSAEVNRVVNLIEPLMVAVIGAIIGTTVVCLYLPLFNLITLIK